MLALAAWNLPSLLAVLIGFGLLPLLVSLARGDKLEDWARPFLLAAAITIFLGALGLLAYLLSGSIFVAAGVVMAFFWTGMAVAGHRLVFGESNWRKDLEARRKARGSGSPPRGDAGCGP